jgi:hypothetical protein
MTENDFSKLNTIKSCPICRGPLERGLVVAPRGVYWNRFSVFDSTAILSQWSWTMPKTPSLRCNNCDIVIISYRKQQTSDAHFKECIRCGERIPVASEYCPRCGAKQKEGVE